MSNDCETDFVYLSDKQNITVIFDSNYMQSDA